MKRPIDNQPEAISVGQKHKFNLDVDIEEIHQFANVSGDWNPLHTDVVYAKSKGYAGGVAHGAWQVGLVSQSLGMWLVGKRCLIGGINIRFHKPLIYPSSIFVESEIYRLVKIELHQIHQKDCIMFLLDSQQPSFE